MLDKDRPGFHREEFRKKRLIPRRRGKIHLRCGNTPGGAAVMDFPAGTHL